MAESDLPTGTENPVDPPAEPTLGDGMFADDFGADPDPTPPAPEEESADEAPQTTEDTPTQDPDVDLLRTPVDQLPEHLLPAAAYAKRVQVEFTRTQQDLADQRREVQAERQQYLEAIQQLQRPPSQPDVDPIQQLRANLTPEEQQGLDIVETLTNAKVAPVVQQLQAAMAKLQQIEASTQEMQSSRKQQTTQAIGVEVAEARSAYGADIDAYRDLIVRLHGQMNPRTGEAFTVKQAYEVASGKAQATSTQLAAGEAQAKRSRQTQARPTPARSADGGNGRSISVEEAMEKLEALGFE